MQSSPRLDNASEREPSHDRDIETSDTQTDMAVTDPEKSGYDRNNDDRPLHAATGKPLSLPREIAVVTVICLAQLMTQAGVGQALATTQITGSSLHITNPATRSWTIAAYSLTVGTLILPAGRWGDIHGHKRLFVIGFLWFGIWSSIGWTTTYTYILLIVGLVLLGIFAFVESRAPYPLIPRTILNARLGFVLGCIACGWATFGIWVYYSFQFLLVLRAQSPLLTSAQFIPCAISGLIAALTTGILMSRVRHAYIMLVALLCFTTGTILLATVPVEQIYWGQTFVSMIVTPWGMDMSFPAGTLILSAAMPREHQGLAASLVSTVVNYSISLGLGFAGTVESNVEPGETLKGFRAAFYMGIGLASLGVVVAAAFTFVSRPSRSARTGMAK
ncbi:MAG: hypothetical protein Q9169_000173 [Polycauliona sp. 2 TL-2023]